MDKNLLLIIREVAEKIETVTDDKKPALVVSLLRLINKLVKTVTAFQEVPHDYMTKIQPALAAQMSAAERRTEKAADVFMTIAEQLSGCLNEVPEPVRNKIQTRVNAIFEGSSFQDLVAQHLNEVKLLINDLTYDIESLNFAIKDLTEESSGVPERRRTVKEKRPDSHLLNGPSTDF